MKLVVALGLAAAIWWCAWRATHPRNPAPDEVMILWDGPHAWVITDLWVVEVRRPDTKAELERLFDDAMSGRL